MFARGVADAPRPHRVDQRFLANRHRDGPDERAFQRLAGGRRFDEGAAGGVGRPRRIESERTGNGGGGVADQAGGGAGQIDGPNGGYVTGFQLFQLQLGKLGGGGAPGVLGRLRLAEESLEHVRCPEVLSNEVEPKAGRLSKQFRKNLRNTVVPTDSRFHGSSQVSAGTGHSEELVAFRPGTVLSDGGWSTPSERLAQLTSPGRRTRPGPAPASGSSPLSRFSKSLR